MARQAKVVKVSPRAAKARMVTMAKANAAKAMKKTDGQRGPHRRREQKEVGDQNGRPSLWNNSEVSQAAGAGPGQVALVWAAVDLEHAHHDHALVPFASSEMLWIASLSPVV